MSSVRVRRALLAAALSLGVCTPSSPAWAVDSVPEITDLTRVERIAGELEDGSLYIHHDLRDRWTDGSREDLEERLASEPLADLSVRVVVYPSVPDDETGGRPTLFLHALHEVSGHDGVYVAVTGDRRVALAAFDSPVRLPDVDTDDLSNAHSSRTEQVLDLVARAPRGSTASSGLVPDAPPSDRDAVRRPRGDAERFWSAALFPGALIGLVLVAVRVRYGRFPTRPPRWWPFPGPEARPSSAESPSRQARTPVRARRWWLRPALRRELRVLRRRIERTPPEHPGMGGARQAYDAAGLIARSAGLPVTALVCAIVLVRYGEQFLDAPDSSPVIPCEANPLHGTATVKRRAHLALREDAWMLCARCAEAVGSSDGYPGVLIVAGSDGSRDLYRHIGDFWTRTAYLPRNAFRRVRDEIGV